MRRALTLPMLAAFLLGACTGTADPTPLPSATESTSSPSPSERPSSAPESVGPSTAPVSEPAAAPATWSELAASADGPAPREDHTWTVTGDGTRALLFGGRDGATVHGDLWSYDLAADTWSRIEAGEGPAPRFGHEATWIDGLGLVVFAGQAGPNFFADLWAFDPDAETWTALPSTGAPPTPRYGTCMALGPDGRLWISHGFTSDGTRFADTRAWDPATGTWTDETPDGDLPVNRCLHGCWWTDSGDLALFGGQTTGVTALDDRWVLAGDTWSRVEGAAPAARNLYARARVAGATLVMGGQAADAGFLADGWWLVDGEADAIPFEAAGEAPPARAGAELVVDDDRDRLLLFGGRDDAGARADLWQVANLSSASP